MLPALQDSSFSVFLLLYECCYRDMVRTISKLNTTEHPPGPKWDCRSSPGLTSAESFFAVTTIVVVIIAVTVSTDCHKAQSRGLSWMRRAETHQPDKTGIWGVLLVACDVDYSNGLGITLEHSSF